MAKVPIPEGVFLNWNISRKKYKPTPSEIEEILKKHKLWRVGGRGERANLSGADLSGADLSGADLRKANLSNARPE